MSLIKARIAPTPSGFLHEGNLVAFLLQKLLAKKHESLLGLRIDDLDRERFREAYLSDIFRCLASLEIQFDFGPKDAEDFHLHHRQDLRLSQYFEVLTRLRSMGLVYACRCSRKEIEMFSGEGCPQQCASKTIPMDESGTVWRLRWPGKTTVTWQDGFMGKVTIDASEKMGDVILRRRDGLPAYQITSLTDDHYLDIGLMVRGQDLVESTAVQQWLSEQLWGKTERIHYHHPLVLSDTGEKLSKSAGAEAKPILLDKEKISLISRKAQELFNRSIPLA